jgi:AbrB family looped-hinge helix DNA binding protein
MTTVTVSPKFQIVIPAQLRKVFEINPGQKLQVLPFKDRIEFLPMRKPKAFRGLFKGMDTTIERESDRV